MYRRQDIDCDVTIARAGHLYIFRFDRHRKTQNDEVESLFYSVENQSNSFA